MSILNVNTIQPIGSGTTVTVAATELKTSNFITVGTGASVTSPSANVLTLGTNNAERVRITSSGLLGIGTVSPSGPVHAHTVSGTQRSYFEASAAHSFLRLKSGSTSYNSGVEFFSGASNIANINGLGVGGLQFEVNGSERFRIDSSGNIGINSTNPAYSLDIVGTNASMRLNSTSTSTLVITSGASNAARIEFGDLANNDTGYIYYDNSNDSMQFATNGSNERFRIHSSGVAQFTTTGTQYPSATVPAFVVNSNGDHALVLNNQNTTDPRGLFIYQDQDVNNGTSYFLRARAGGTDRAHLYSNGTLQLHSGNLKLASGNGIDFSATGNSSGTMTSELLDDYEEGSWTPNFTFNGNSTGVTYSNRGGLYTRVGRLVTCYCMIVLSAKGSSTGNVLVTGLPYTATDLVAGTAIEGGGLAVYQDDTVGTHTGPIQATVINNQTYFELYRITSTNPGHSDNVTNGNVANNSSYRFVLQYTAV